MRSMLNPEAPEFFPHFTSVTQGGYVSVNKSIKSSNVFPSRSAHEIFKTFTEFNVLTCQLSENVVLQSNQIIATELPAVKLKRNEPDFNTEKIIDVNDSIIDRINIHIDNASGVNDSSEKNKIYTDVKPNFTAKVNIAPWNAPVIERVQVGSATLIGSKNIPRPQFNFKDAIDNSESLWVPKISDKPNNIKPLALNILYNEEGEAVGYEHPYKVELDLYHPPSHFIEPDKEPLPFPTPIEEAKFTYVNSEAQLDSLVEHLNGVKELAIDLEHHSYRTYQGITCLIQITTTEGGDFIIDALAIREHIHKLNLAFTDPKKLKVFHGAEHDIVWLQRDFGVYVVGMFDTHQAAKVLSLPGLALKYLLQRYCQVNVDKKYQLADWRLRPLPAELIHYARMDTHYLLYIWRQMKADLLKDGQPHSLLSVFESSRQICGATYNKEVVTETSHMGLFVRSKKTFSSQQMAALKMLYKWRDSQARALDESTSYLLPNHMLLALAETLPREVQGVNAICSPMPPFVKKNIIAIHRMILSCREMPNEPQLYQMPASIRNMVNASIQPINTFTIHDTQQYSEFGEETPTNFEPTTIEPGDFIDYNFGTPIIKVFSQPNDYGTIVSDLNAEAKLFVPPFDRYRKYRTVAQLEEMKEFKEKEAKISAISKGNELIKAEVLEKLQNVQENTENEDKKKDTSVKAEPEETDETHKKTQQRKRKMSTVKNDTSSPNDDATDNKNKELVEIKKETNDRVKPFAYEHADYTKFYDKANSEHKQKMKFKKYKK